MSVPTLQGIQTALSGLLAGQEALDVTGQNIANAQTAGYTRQTAVLTTNPYIKITALDPNNGRGADLGTGVGLQTITRIRNAYLEGQYLAQTTASSEAGTLTETLEQVQNLLGEPSSSGISNALSSFWNAWNALASEPTSTAGREVVVAAGSEVAALINHLSAGISAASEEAAERYVALTGESGQIASDAEQIATLTGQITLAEQGGQQPNELLDRREALIESLSKLARVSVSEGEFGTLTLSFGDAATPLVEGKTVNWPQTLTAAAGGELGTLLALSESGGKLAGLQEALNGVAESLASTVNALQPLAPFFSYTAGSAAATIAVAATPAQVQTGPEGEPGANSYALEVANLRGGEAEQLYSAFVTRVGSEVAAARHGEADAEAMLSAIAQQRQMTSGVSLDEEMTNMLTFQRGYQASARALTAMDEALEVLINRTGKAGL